MAVKAVFALHRDLALAGPGEAAELDRARCLAGLRDGDCICDVGMMGDLTSMLSLCAAEAALWRRERREAGYLFTVAPWLR